MRTYSLKYLIKKTIDWYIDQQKIDIEEFNTQNNFTKSKVVLLPFFLAMGGNGSMEMIYNEFGPFYATANGPNSPKLNEFFESFVDIDSVFGINFSNSDSSIKIVNKDLFIDEILIDEADKELAKAIDHSISNLKKTIPQLITFSTFDLLIMCHQFQSSFVFRLNHPSHTEILVSDIKLDRSYYYLAGNLNTPISRL